MKKKRPAKGKRTKRGKPHTLSQAMRADDERLREELRNANVAKLDAVIGKAIAPGAS